MLAKADKLEIQEILCHGKIFLYAGIVGTVLGLVLSFEKTAQASDIRYTAAIALLPIFYGTVIYYFINIFRKS